MPTHPNKVGYFPIDRVGEPSGKPNDFHWSEQSEKEYPEQTFPADRCKHLPVGKVCSGYSGSRLFDPVIILSEKICV